MSFGSRSREPRGWSNAPLLAGRHPIYAGRRFSRSATWCSPVVVLAFACNAGWAAAEDDILSTNSAHTDDRCPLLRRLLPHVW